MYFAGNEGATGGGGAPATGDGVATGVVVTAGGRPGSRGAVAQPATITRAAAAVATRAANERRDPDKMVWFFLEALVALLIAVGIVAWTMGPKRRKPPRVTTSDADRDKIL
jgi:hypothetical protein